MNIDEAVNNLPPVQIILMTHRSISQRVLETKKGMLRPVALVTEEEALEVVKNLTTLQLVERLEQYLFHCAHVRDLHIPASLIIKSTRKAGGCPKKWLGTLYMLLRELLMEVPREATVH